MPLRPHRRRTASPSSRRDVDGSPNPHRRRSRSSNRRESRDGDRRRRNSSPVRRESRDGDRRRSRSPVSRESRDRDRRRRSPVRRESRDGDRRRSSSPIRQSLSYRRRRSRSPSCNSQSHVGDLRRSHSSVRRPAELQWVEKDAKPVLLYWAIASFMGRCEIDHLADDFVDRGQKMGFKICPPYLYREDSVVSSLSSYERVKMMWDRMFFLGSPDFVLCLLDRDLDIHEHWKKLLNEHKIYTFCISLSDIDGTDRQKFLESTLLEISKVQAAGRAGGAPGRGVVPPVRR